MKKWLIILLVLLLAFLAFIYLFIPKVISINAQVFIKYPRLGLERVLFANENWEKWWPADSLKKTKGTLNNPLSFNNYDYTIREKKTSSILIDINKNNRITPSSVNLFYENKNDAIIKWTAHFESAYNPIKKIYAYFEAKKLEADLRSILYEIQSFFSRSENIYGSVIEERLVVDSILIFTEAGSTSYPSTALIYSLIERLKKNIEKNSVKETGFPMLNISTIDSINYLIKVAIPVDKETPVTGNFSYKKMMKMGNILVSEVKGGPYRISQVFKQIELYISDHERVPPAIPFLSLVTNRMLEPDSNKWTTIIYYPVM